MITIEYGLSTYENLLKQICKALKVKYSKNIVNIPAAYGKGFFRLLSFPDGIECMIFNATFNTEIHFHQKKIKEENLIIRLDNEHVLEKDYNPEVQLNKTNRKWIYMAAKSQTISGINILFHQDAMNQFFGESEAGIQINNHLNLLTNLFYNEPMDAEYKKWFHEIFDARENEFINFVIYNRIMLICERVFRRFYKKISGNLPAGKFSADDLSRVKDAEAIFIQDFSEQPMPLNKLSKLAAMSASKFKIIFKEIYGLPPHKYFAKQRMNKARAMILSNQYSLYQILEELGFEKKSGFKSAYEKMFGMLPEISTEKSTWK
ncbi:MAG: AraC family transcriptional regulator [Bacteroidota bacterium]